jgi:hypothetical protein
MSRQSLSVRLGAVPSSGKLVLERKIITGLSDPRQIYFRDTRSKSDIDAAIDRRTRVRQWLSAALHGPYEISSGIM